MAARKGARYLAPLALAAAVAGTYFVVHQNLHSRKPAATARQLTNRLTTPAAHVRPRHGSPRFYVVRPGDNLSEIALRTGVSLATIETLNPAIDPSSLQVGHRLRLR
jgi:LysM repeat protein